MLNGGGGEDGEDHQEGNIKYFDADSEDHQDGKIKSFGLKRLH